MIVMSRVEVLKRLNQLAQRYPNLKFWDTMTRFETTLTEYIEKWARIRSEETLNQVLETRQELVNREPSFS
jgi:hypothetical protein